MRDETASPELLGTLAQSKAIYVLLIKNLLPFPCCCSLTTQAPQRLLLSPLDVLSPHPVLQPPQGQVGSEFCHASERAAPAPVQGCCSLPHPPARPGPSRGDLQPQACSAQRRALHGEGFLEDPLHHDVLDISSRPENTWHRSAKSTEMAFASSPVLLQLLFGDVTLLF